MWLSQNYHLSEFTRSQTASRQGIDNSPSQEHLDNLIMLVTYVLEPICEAWQQKAEVSSGYRSPALNRAVGGAKTSQHCNGMAADVEIPGVDNCDLARWIAENLEFDQLILEFHRHSAGPNDGWVHVSFNAAGNRREVLTAQRNAAGKTVYLQGLVT